MQVDLNALDTRMIKQHLIQPELGVHSFEGQPAGNHHIKALSTVYASMLVFACKLKACLRTQHANTFVHKMYNEAKLTQKP